MMSDHDRTINVSTFLSEDQQIAMLKRMGKDLAVKVHLMGFPTPAALLVFTEYLNELADLIEADPETARFVEECRKTATRFQDSQIPKLRLAWSRPKGTA